ncbi:hypothetical protein AB6A40_008831 [Gnathostoma spinigerum]|uniref:glucuronosyltransferase n=1 Tax=Gnathostoma spinigerum TaxID=75299 RepID=A0ABD6ESK6_9BILA
MLFDTIRPINNRIKYFGCQTCRSPEQYRTIIPSDFLHWNSAENLQDAGGKNIVTQHEIVIRRNTNKTYWRCNTFSTSSIKEPQIRRHWNHSCIDKVDHLGLHVSRHTALIATDRKTDWLSITKKRRQNKCTLKEWLFEPIEMYRFRSMQKKFPTFDFGRLERSKFIIVSFGSIAKTEYMAFELLDSMLDTFSHLKYTVIWQTNCDHDKMLRGRSLPKNIIMSRWLPLKELFGHPNLMYFVSHGGINTINEILSFGVPIVGVPLQGDQSSNIQRIVELGVGNSVSVREIWNGRLPEVLANMENNLQRYRRRSKKVAVMLADQRKLTKGIQHFWLHWAERNGPKLKVKNRRFFDLKYRSSFDYFSGLQVLFSMGIFFGLLFVLSTSY